MSKVKVTDEVFSCVKRLLSTGAPYAEISNYMKISTWAVGMIAKSEDMTEYKNICAAVRLRNKPKVEPKKEEPPKMEPKNDNTPKIEDLKMPGGTLSSGYQMNRIYEALKEQNEHLKLISNKLAFIVEALT